MKPKAFSRRGSLAGALLDRTRASFQNGFSDSDVHDSSSAGVGTGEA